MASRRRVRGHRQLTEGLDGVGREPHLTTAEEMDHRRKGLLTVSRDLAHGLYHVTECQDRRCRHEHRFLCTKVHGSYGWTIPGVLPC
jgi:hypothetical protein